jgi:putative Ca2+/H+ antiporter (TMEM165/GDT1 family)
MSVTALLALVCIVVAFVGEIIDEKVLMGTLELVAAIAFNTLGVTYTLGRKSGP